MGYLTIFLCGCENKRQALWSEDEIIVISAMEDEVHLQSVLSKIFNDTLFTPEPEPYYKLIFVPPIDFNSQDSPKFAVFIAPLLVTA